MVMILKFSILICFYISSKNAFNWLLDEANTTLEINIIWFYSLEKIWIRWWEISWNCSLILFTHISQAHFIHTHGTRYLLYKYVDLKSRNLSSSDSTEQVGRSDKQKPGHDNKLPDSCFLLIQLLPDKLFLLDTWSWNQWMPISYNFRILKLQLSEANWNRKILKIIMLC